MLQGWDVVCVGFDGVLSCQPGLARGRSGSDHVPKVVHADCVYVLGVWLQGRGLGGASAVSELSVWVGVCARTCVWWVGVCAMCAAGSTVVDCDGYLAMLRVGTGCGRVVNTGGAFPVRGPGTAARGARPSP